MAKFEAAEKPNTPKDVLKMADAAGVQVVDFKFMDLPGQWQHFSVPRHQLEESSFEEGFGFDGSSIRGWKEINESDMLVLPDPQTAFIDPFNRHKTLSLVCNILDPITKERYSRDPRSVAYNVENYVKSSGIADTVYIGPELEFFVFDGVRFDSKPYEAYYHIESDEGVWSSGRPSEPVIRTWGGAPATRRATSRCPPSTACRTCAAR